MPEGNYVCLPFVSAFASISDAYWTCVLSIAAKLIVSKEWASKLH